ncbi:DUF2179 domain-containing protein [Flexilinea flocculi]|jgi:uncharacterized protein YebE (UPF0316 family)|uniref:Uncharacterized protein YebE, UPF0316 family n=1 Tax=Flexilinea flocculi TaxID=1678840 RepID=A0A0K8P9L8_9CHLR|nr:DUF5698 domain-containing protein [Flexilinea flocculi]NMB92864.1 DUF2179 domain-containing protein [Flexilinea flocculi]GAP39326.1 uncharacterized protein YebE, UPF0316 family [Flexilinea flocculi]
MEMLFTKEILVGGLLIFVLRVLDTSMDTLRVLFVVRGKKVLVWLLGATQATLFILAISRVLSGENNLITILGYSLGFATGNIIGMTIEERLAVGYKKISIISRDSGSEIASALRDAGYGVTELCGKGKDGDVCMLHANIKRKHVKDVEKIVNGIDKNAFITSDDFNPVNRSGFWRK